MYSWIGSKCVSGFRNLIWCALVNKNARNSRAYPSGYWYESFGPVIWSNSEKTTHFRMSVDNSSNSISFTIVLTTNYYFDTDINRSAWTCLHKTSSRVRPLGKTFARWNVFFPQGNLFGNSPIPCHIVSLSPDKVSVSLFDLWAKKKGNESQNGIAPFTSNPINQFKNAKKEGLFTLKSPCFVPFTIWLQIFVLMLVATEQSLHRTLILLAAVQHSLAHALFLFTSYISHSITRRLAETYCLLCVLPFCSTVIESQYFCLLLHCNIANTPCWPGILFSLSHRSSHNL